MSSEGKWLAHMVYFTLKDNSPEAVEKLLAGCREHLAGHPGQRLFAVGTRTSDLTREVNDQQFDVALQIVFESREAHDVYQTHARHLQFIAQHRDSWKTVRVFDADCGP